MKIRTYTAKDMRSALRQVREEQGLNAVILSTRSVPGGVEVSAAIDADSIVFEQAAAPPVTPAPADFASLMANARAPDAAPVPQFAPRVEDAASSQMGAELRSMRHLLESQLAQLAWNDLTRRAWAGRGARQ